MYTETNVVTAHFGDRDFGETVEKTIRLGDWAVWEMAVLLYDVDADLFWDDLRVQDALQRCSAIRPGSDEPEHIWQHIVLQSRIWDCKNEIGTVDLLGYPISTLHALVDLLRNSRGELLVTVDDIAEELRLRTEEVRW